MKSMKRTAVVLAMAVVMAVVIGSAEAGEKEYKFKVVGSFHSGTTVVVSAGGRSTLGEKRTKVVIDSVIEGDFSQLTAPVTCPDGEGGVQVPLATESDIHRVRGNLLFGELELSSGTFCFNEATCFSNGAFPMPGCTFSFAYQSTIMGGTGKFEGASGSINIIGSSTIRVVDENGGLFGGTTAEGEGVINIPGEDAEEEDDDDGDDDDD